jgi:ankyrin repeat protein
VNARDAVGRTALLLAVIRGHDDILPLLFEHGADVNARDNNGDTCLSLSGSDHITELLRKAGAKE